MDTVAQFITMIRNASQAKHDKVDIPNSRMRQNLAEVLKSEGLIRNFKVVRDGKQGIMRVYLKYSDTGEPLINSIQRASRPGRRYYVRSSEIPKIRSGFGIAVLSTNKGVMTGQKATELKVGGELLIKIW